MHLIIPNETICHALFFGKEVAETENMNSTQLKYRIRTPEKITFETPVLYMLHGYGSNDEDLFSFAPTLPEDWMIISLQAPLTTQYGGFFWYDIDFSDAEKLVNTAQAETSKKAVLQIMDEITRQYHLENNPTHLVGFSQGGILSYALALENPERFQKIACLSTYPEEKIMQNKVTDKKRLQHLRFFVSHGTDDAVIPLEWGRKAADLLYDLSCFFSFREYMSGHSVNQKNYMDLMDFFRK